MRIVPCFFQGESSPVARITVFRGLFHRIGGTFRLCLCLITLELLLALLNTKPCKKHLIQALLVSAAVALGLEIFVCHGTAGIVKAYDTGVFLRLINGNRTEGADKLVSIRHLVILRQKISDSEEDRKFSVLRMFAVAIIIQAVKEKVRSAVENKFLHISILYGIISADAAVILGK